VGESLRIIQLYEDLFGPFPFREVDVAEMVENMGYWQAPPGLILITKYERIVQWIDNPKRDSPHFASAILSHEIAHQYWGHVVGWATSDDQWMSEALAEYSSHLYISQYYGEHDYDARLNGWRREAREGAEFGAMALAGGRLGRGSTPLWYDKGPYVMHMLRAWLGDEAFVDLLRCVCEVVANRELSTSGFLAIAEKFLGLELGWFFDAWIHGHQLPAVEGTYQPGSGKGAAGTLTLTQTQPGDPMKLRVPVLFTLDAAKKKKAKQEWRIVVIVDREMTVVIDGLKGVVVKVEIDPLQTSLWAGDPGHAKLVE